jgi:hypothetical protein
MKGTLKIEESTTTFHWSCNYEHNDGRRSISSCCLVSYIGT